MNKVYYCYYHKNSKLKLYGIYNTVYDLPETIPMDISTFLKFHIETGHPIIQFIKIYQASEFCNRKTKLNSGFYSPEKKMIYSLIKASKLNFSSDETLSYINEIEKIIKNTEFQASKIVRLVKQKLKNFNLIKKPSYFLSYAHSVKCFKESGDSLKYYRIFYSEEAIKRNIDIILQFYVTYKIPASAIPHIIRNKKSIKEILIFRNMQHLLPTVLKQKLQHKTTFTFFEKEVDVIEIRGFYKMILKYDYHLTKEIYNYLKQLNTTIDEININDLITFGHDPLYPKTSNFKNNTGELLLPPGMFFETYGWDNEKYIILDKFGFQNFSIFSREGDLIMMNAEGSIYFTEENCFIVSDWCDNKTKYIIRDYEAYPAKQQKIDFYCKTNNKKDELPFADTDNVLPF